jgi:hypothetical protein
MVHTPNTKRRLLFLIASLPLAAATFERMPQTTETTDAGARIAAMRRVT